MSWKGLGKESSSYYL